MAASAGILSGLSLRVCGAAKPPRVPDSRGVRLFLNAWIAFSYVFGFAALARAAQRNYVSEFSFFFSYLIYFLMSGAALLLILAFFPTYFPTLFWIRFFTLVTAEFALLLEIGDHIFRDYPAIRQLGRTLTYGIGIGFSIVYIFPPLLGSHPTDVMILGLIKRSALTKGVILLCLLGAGRRYKVPLDRATSGIALGLAVYLAIFTANFALDEHFGHAVYGRVFSIIGPFAQTLTVLIWTVSLWNYRPALAGPPTFRDGRPLGDLGQRLERFNTMLTGLLRR